MSGAPYIGAVLERLGDIQLALRALGLEGWLLYDYRGQCPSSSRALGLTPPWPSRRWFYWLPAEGMPALVPHATELELFGELPGDVLPYHDWTSLRSRLERLLPQRGSVAMSHQEIGGNPDLSRVDAGTVQLVQSYGPRVTSSAELTNRFLGPWRARDLEAHAAASTGLDRAIATAREFMNAESNATEGDVRRELERALDAESLVVTTPPVVSFGESTAQRAGVRARRDASAAKGELALIELSARTQELHAPFAHRIAVSAVGEPPKEVRRAFEVAVAARDAALELLRTRIEADKRVLGFEVDVEAQRVIEGARIGARVLHRTGHHLGWVPMSGEACTFDSLEIHDVREALSGLAWSVHPGVYFESYGLTAPCAAVQRRGATLEALCVPEREIHVIGG